jgi:hypothetical protein
MRTVRKTYENCSPLKNPKQSKLYKWLYENNIKYYDQSAVVFIMLYRYIITNEVENAGSNNAHGKNVIAILELMKEKAT